MRKYFIVAAILAAIGVAVAFISPQPAGAFVANQNGIAKAATAANTIIEVKRSPSKGRPPGWNFTVARWAGTDIQGYPVNFEDERSVKIARGCFIKIARQYAPSAASASRRN